MVVVESVNIGFSLELSWGGGGVHCACTCKFLCFGSVVF